jgi:hypothetical protein
LEAQRLGLTDDEMVIPSSVCPWVDGNTLFASSWPIGLSQQYASVFQNELPQFKNRNYSGLATLLQKKIREILDPALQTAGHAARVIGQAAQSDVLCSSLLATEFKDGLQLIEISAQGGFECLTPQLPYVCQGSGKQNADPFLAFIWSVYFSSSRPNINEAVLAAYWTVKVAIDLKSSGVGFAPDVSVLEKVTGGPGYAARQLGPNDLKETNDFISEAEGALRSIRDRMKPSGGAVSLPPTLSNPGQSGSTS